MSTLAERLQRIKSSFLERAPAEAVEAIDRSAAELRAAGLLDGAPAVGSSVPPFALADTEGEVVRSEALLGEGALIVTFYRGVW